MTLSIAINLKAIAIFDGTTNIAESTTVDGLTVFTNINGGAGLVANDDTSKTFSVYATFEDEVIDNQQIQLIVNSANTGSGSSQFASADAGGALTPTTGNTNRILVEASDLSFDIAPTDVAVNNIMAPDVVVTSVDANGNTDVDFTGNVDLTLSGASTTTFDPSATTSSALTSGSASFANLIFDSLGVDNELIATSNTLTNSVPSANFDVVGNLPAGWPIPIAGDIYTVNFDTTVSGVNNGQFAGTGNVPGPIAGQLDSDSWSLATSTNTLAVFGADNSAGVFARGASTGDVAQSGFYAFEVAPETSALGVQPDDAVFTPGNITLQARNVTGNEVTSVVVQYTVYVRNNTNASNSFNFLVQ